ncbi:MAG: nucleotide exchange factor GrpE [Dehalococcoidia bacterium]|nr:nucleotide exchange factor GrpE [Dehalococcoidia bacterium]
MMSFEQGDMSEFEKTGHAQEDGDSSEDMQALRQELDAAKAKAQEYLDGWQRGQADFTNYKKRLELDKLDAIRYANADMMLKILPVLDDFERAAEHVPPQMASDPWVGGVNGIARKLENVLEVLGLSRIKAQDEVFDPSVHEAVSSVPGPDGMVVGELGKGYMLNERVLRPAKVMVGNGEDNK